jgi:hypothetical protein
VSRQVAGDAERAAALASLELSLNPARRFAAASLSRVRLDDSLRARSDWGSGIRNATVVTLDAIEQSEMQRLAGALPSDDDDARRLTGASPEGAGSDGDDDAGGASSDGGAMGNRFYRGEPHHGQTPPGSI